MAKTKPNLISKVCFLLCFVVSVATGNGSSDMSNTSVSNQSQNETEEDGSTLSLVLGRLEALENKHQKLKKSHTELKERFKSLKKELEDFKSENCVGDDVWLLTRPIRGRRGQKGEKGDSGIIATKSGEKPGQKGEKGGGQVQLPSPSPTEQKGESGTSVLRTDKTLEQKATGAEVVKAVIHKIQRSGIFNNSHDYTFLQRLAYGESQFGENPQTFRPQFYGGIWQISREHYEKTKSEQLSNYHFQIMRVFNISWKLTSWTDLLKPLHSGLAAQLLLVSFREPIPQVLSRQADYRRRWNLQSPFGLSTEGFKTNIKRMEAGQACTGKMDLLVIMDESGSVGLPHFKKSLQFVANLFKSYENAPQGNVRMGFITYDHIVRAHIPVRNTLTLNKIIQKVLSTSYGNGATKTNAAIQVGIDHFTNGQHGYWARDGVPKIMAVFTDGQSHDGVNNSAKARRLGITTFAVGIGAGQNQNELNQITNGDPSRIFSLDDFDALAEFFGILNSATCTVSQKPRISTSVVDTVKNDEKRIYCYQVPAPGITVTLNVSSPGGVTGYFSYTYETPSKALNDGILDQGKNYIPHRNETQVVEFNPFHFKEEPREPQEEGRCDVYVTIQGVGGPRNNYTVTAENGNTLP